MSVEEPDVAIVYVPKRNSSVISVPDTARYTKKCSSYLRQRDQVTERTDYGLSEPQGNTDHCQTAHISTLRTASDLNIDVITVQEPLHDIWPAYGASSWTHSCTDRVKQ
ncbi:hypothetical protein AVEN_170668-1 [Araneus ventricosus]|uniref:Uncharacterized protein n=1 Tax=Araneus ventricosus TaxID=182803 RepID=A0A4Y2LNP6_ARAVE|nr:hypothetical protein AVEN_272141-1 [Araneus ventricosus]GBN15341.1 hypothetical protein AVEN_28071-1 [Araneus ventricosus]GBN16411.1 hypothetical protein AVEN_91390-1 [Araneus ventricosus]GBN16434.1 hypothetical protein AVEN_170668-1 [Araneus ventricosus]